MSKPIKTSKVDDATRVSDVIVVGAGASGLGAARKIAEAGRSVITLEARNRIGGRIWTDRATMGVPIERGAELITGTQSSTWPIARGIGLDTHPLVRRLARFDSLSAWVSDDSDAFTAFPGHTPDLPDHLPTPLKAETVKEYLERMGIESDNYPLAIRALEFDTEAFAIQPVEHFAEVLGEALGFGAAESAAVFADGDFRVIGGYDQILVEVAKGLDVRFDTVVGRVSYGEDKVTISTSAGEFVAAAVIMAVPAGVLQSETIEFAPPLPEARLEALRSITYIPIFKAALEFAEPMLPSGVDILIDCSLEVPCVWNASAGNLDYQGQVVVAWATGAHARKLLAIPERERSEAATRSIREIVGDPTISPLRTAMHDWSKDPFARGAYPGWGPLPHEIYEPVGRVHWAGIVTENVSDSYDTGERSAEMVLNFLGATKP